MVIFYNHVKSCQKPLKSNLGIEIFILDGYNRYAV